jgi:hypothetical protein
MLQISVYFKHGNLDPSPQLVGEHKRSAYYNGQVNLSDELDRRLGLPSKGSSEKVFITGISESRPQVVLRLSPTVSASEQLRDELRNAVNSRRHDGVKFMELEYQPAPKRRPPWLFR